MKKFNKVSNTWFKFLKYTIEFVFFIILIYYLCNCSLYQYKNSEFKVSGLLLLSLILFYYLFYKLFKKIESKSPIAYKISLFIVSLLLKASSTDEYSFRKLSIFINSIFLKEIELLSSIIFKTKKIFIISKVSSSDKSSSIILETSSIS